MTCMELIISSSIAHHGQHGGLPSDAEATPIEYERNPSSEVEPKDCQRNDDEMATECGTKEGTEAKLTRLHAIQEEEGKGAARRV
eukprot:CAMPEP_0206048682 /NCGR_PEP_ID=MMETSP1466-20131121/24814_1 /ASSEMBLY_ACC=CAM_ASM_001126 /TAXON_ID=44452 /ORGANISM="Pavlova gyrans, Strain CCMP608" /LENGTH=84 /DNA_ID=CAMNT_0053423749 /DNA_START=84 /DNA_END=339 /DNA_ORIENTATION=+